MRKLDRSAFLKEAKALFPQLRDEINQQKGSFIFEVDVLTHFVKSLIDAGDRENVKKAFQLVDKYLGEGNSDVTTVLCISFLEALDLTDDKVSRSWAKKYFSTQMKASYDSVMAYKNRK